MYLVLSCGKVCVVEMRRRPGSIGAAYSISTTLAFLLPRVRSVGGHLIALAFAGGGGGAVADQRRYQAAARQRDQHDHAQDDDRVLRDMAESPPDLPPVFGREFGGGPMR